jgi:hypothetical protein
MPAARAGGTVTNATEAALRSAMAGGGLVTFACDGTITLTNTLTNVFDTVVDATGHNISLRITAPTSPYIYWQVLCIPTNTSLTLIGLTIDNGYSGGGYYDTRGGGILNAGGTLNLVGVTLRNIALGMFGGSVQGGALANMGGWVNATNCLFSHNAAWLGTYSSTAGAEGGAVANILGHFTAQNCTFDGNAALGSCEYSPWPGDNGTWAYGGAIYNTGTLELRNCTFSGNSASGAPGVSGAGGYTGSNGLDGMSGGSGGSGLGSAIFSSGSASLVNCTITGNQASGADGAPGGNGRSSSGYCCGGNGGSGGSGGSGLGAIYATSGLTMTNCTFVSNIAAAGHGAAGGAGGGAGMPPPHGAPGSPGPNGGPGIAAGGLIASNSILINSILANNSPAGDTIGTDLGHNLSSGSTFSEPSSLNNTDPRLGPLAQNGGSTATLALLPGSPAIDAGETASAPATDQRGFARPCGRAADIGAYEYNEPTPFTFASDTSAVTITGYNGTDGAVTIPGTIDNLPVTSIGSSAFQYRSSLTSVTIPNSVTNIGDLAFAGCSNLASVYFEGNAPSTGPDVFALDDKATVYFQAGTTGWGSSFGGRPTALWAMPRVRTPPQSQTAEVGSSVRFQVMAEGDPAVGFQWYFNGTSRLSCTNPILQLTNVQPSHAGAYTVVAANLGASVTSAPVLLSVIPPLPRTMVPVLTLIGPTGTMLNLDSREAFDSSSAWTTFDAVSLTSTSQWYVDLRVPLARQRFYRSWTADPLHPPYPLDLHMVPAITLTGIIGGSVRVDGINQFGPTDAWWTIDTITLTNCTQLFFDTSSIGQPPRLWRFAALNVVTSLADSGSGSLRQTLANAAPGDTIVFGINGTISLTGGALGIGKDISIVGPGASLLAISGNRTNRIFSISNGVNVFISGLTLRDGRGRDGPNGTSSSPPGAGEPGGAITNAGSLALWNCVLTNNRAGDGGGYSGGTKDGGAGGAIYSTGALSASNCVFAGNASGSGGWAASWSGGGGGDGGAIWSSGSVSMNNCTVSSNVCGVGACGSSYYGIAYGGPGGSGGGIYATSNLCLVGCTVSGNSAGAGACGGNGIGTAGGGGGWGGSGGGIYVGALLVATNSTLSGNSCGGGGSGGGGVYAGSGGNGGSGGAIYCANGATNIAVNCCTIVGNPVGIAGTSGSGPPLGPPPANGSGDGICLSSPAVLGGFLNNIVALGVWRTQDVAGVFNSLGHNLIGATNGSSGFTATGDLVGSAALLLDPLVGPLTNNGGLTLTMALLPGSPAIDAGSPVGVPPTDQRGVTRPYGPAVDIGAYEYSP